MGRSRVVPLCTAPDRASRWLLVVLALGSGAGPHAFGQVSPRLVIEPWREEPHWAETTDEILVFESAGTRSPGEHARVFYWDSLGRIKVERHENDPAFSLGYKVLTMDMEADDTIVDGQLNDVALVAAGRLGEVVEGWQFHLMAGLGTANDGHWSDVDALYGVGAINAAKKLDEHNTLHLGITYDGNRGILPDIPLPSATFATRLDERLECLFGFPDTLVRVKPLGDLSLTFHYAFPVETEARAEYRFLDGLSAFAEYARTFDGFHLDEKDDRRIFYLFDRVGFGIRWVTEWLDVSIGAGYAFNHRFGTGFDLRDVEDVERLDSGWYGLIRVQGGL